MSLTESGSQTTLVEITHDVLSREAAQRDQQHCLTPPQALPWPLFQVYPAPKASWHILFSGRCRPCREGSHAVGPLGRCPPHGPEGSPCTPCDLRRERLSLHCCRAEHTQIQPWGTRAGKKNKPVYLYWYGNIFLKFLATNKRHISQAVIFGFAHTHHTQNITSLDCLVDGWRQVAPQLCLGSKFQQHADTGCTATAAGIEQWSDAIDGGCIDLQGQHTQSHPV